MASFRVGTKSPELQTPEVAQAWGKLPGMNTGITSGTNLVPVRGSVVEFAAAVADTSPAAPAMAPPALAAVGTKEGAVSIIDLEDDYDDNLNEKKKSVGHSESVKDGPVAAPQSVTSTSPDPPSLSESESYEPTEVPTPSTLAPDQPATVTKVPVDLTTVVADESIKVAMDFRHEVEKFYAGTNIVCQVCQQVQPGERFPMPARCFFCKAFEPMHHGRCCPERKKDKLDGESSSIGATTGIAPVDESKPFKSVRDQIAKVERDISPAPKPKSPMDRASTSNRLVSTAPTPPTSTAEAPPDVPPPVPPPPSAPDGQGRVVSFAIDTPEDQIVRSRSITPGTKKRLTDLETSLEEERQLRMMELQSAEARQKESQRQIELLTTQLQHALNLVQQKSQLQELPPPPPPTTGTSAGADLVMAGDLGVEETLVEGDAFICLTPRGQETPPRSATPQPVTSATATSATAPSATEPTSEAFQDARSGDQLSGWQALTGDEE